MAHNAGHHLTVHRKRTPLVDWPSALFWIGVVLVLIGSGVLRG